MTAASARLAFFLGANILSPIPLIMWFPESTFIGYFAYSDMSLSSAKSSPTSDISMPIFSIVLYTIAAISSLVILIPAPNSSSDNP